MAFYSLKRLGKLCFLAGLMLKAQAALAGTLTNVSVTAADNTPGATTSYTFTYTLETDVNADEALLYVTFPTGFTVADGACDRIDSFTLNPDPGGVLCRASYGSGNTVAFAVNTSGGGGEIVPAGTAVTVVVGGVTNPATPADYVFDPSGTPNFDTGIRTVSQPGDFMPTEIDVAPQQTITIGAGSLVNGSCGSSNSGVFSSAPSGNLCTTGNASAVTSNPTTYTWNCNGSGGGTNASCSADKGYDLILSISPPSGGSVACTNNPVKHGDSTSCTATASTGYSFVNWSGDCSGASCELTNVTSQLNPQANFSLNSYAVTTQVSPVGAGSVSCSNNPVDHADDTSCTYTANPGYTFANWSGDCSGASCNLVGVLSAKTVTANFIPPSFSITTAVAPAGAGTATCSSNTVVLGGSSSCTASAAVGYNFTGWSGDCSGVNCALTAVAADKLVTANFALATYSITATASPTVGGSVSCTASVEHGGTGSCTATANTGYSFAGWAGCSSVNGAVCSLSNVTSNRTIRADFTLNSYLVTATINPVSAGTASCTSPVNHGSSASCTATAATGYALSGWSGACVGSSCSIASVTSNTTVTANFELLPTYNVSTASIPSEGGSVSCTQNIVSGTSGSCTAKANLGFRFTGWGGDCAGTATTCSLTNVTTAKSVTANFEEAKGPFYGYLLGETLRGEVSTLMDGITPGFTIKASVDNFRGWKGDCATIIGTTCTVGPDPFTRDVYITMLTGALAKNTLIKPSGAGAVWCDGGDRVPVDENVRPVMDNCVVDANPGFTYVSANVPSDCRIGLEESCQTVEVNFTAQADIPVVACTDCNISSTTTDTSTTTIVSKTTEPDAQGNTTASTVATTKNTETGDTTTSARVNGVNQAGEVQTGSNVSTNASDASVVVNNDNTVTLSTANATTGTTTSAVVSNLGTQVQTAGSTVNTKQSVDVGLSTSIEQSEQGTSLTFVNESDGSVLGKTTVTTTETTSEFNNSPTIFAPFKFDVEERISVTRIDTKLIDLEEQRALRIVRDMEERSTLISIIGLDSSPQTDVPPGYVFGGVPIILGGSDYDLRDPAFDYASISGTAEVTGVGANLTVTNAVRSSTAQGTVATESQPRVSFDLTDDALESIRIYSESSGVVEFFKPDSNSASPQLTGFESTDESFSITLSYPATK